jgi:hypothetical protein
MNDKELTGRFSVSIPEMQDLPPVKSAQSSWNRSGGRRAGRSNLAKAAMLQMAAMSGVIGSNGHVDPVSIDFTELEGRIGAHLASLDPEQRQVFLDADWSTPGLEPPAPVGLHRDYGPMPYILVDSLQSEAPHSIVGTRKRMVKGAPVAPYRKPNKFDQAKLAAENKIAKRRAANKAKRKRRQR